MSPPRAQDDKQSATEWIKRNFSWVRRASSPRNPGTPDARPATATDVPHASTSLSPPLPVSVQPNHLTSTAPGPTGIDHNPNSSTPSDDKTDISCSPGTASQTAPSELPSRVEETLAGCPRFRIVLVGNTGVGKSTLVRSIFNIVYNVRLPNSGVGTTIDIAHDRVGKADITYEYYSHENPRFILHDSMGFETGSTEKSEIVESFLRDRAERNAELPDQVHAIWLCIRTPTTGARLLQTSDENLLKLAKELKIPVIIVFTKYDILVVEHYRACSHILSVADRKLEATKRANQAFSEATNGLKLEGLKVTVPFVPVTTMNEEYRGAMLVELTQVTRDNLKDVAGPLWAIWATAQQINARQKVELSISEGLKKYWRDLGESVFFKDHRMVDCIGRIHNDVLKIWNFNDPSKVLSGEEFLKGMIGLVEPLSCEVIQVRNQRVDDTAPVANSGLAANAGIAANLFSVAGVVGGGVAIPVTVVGTTMAYQFLQSKYQKGASTATYLSAYIVDLILVLHEVSMVVLVDRDLPKDLSTDLVMDALATYKLRSSDIHTQVKEGASIFKPEEKIATVIRDSLSGSSP